MVIRARNDYSQGEVHITFWLVLTNTVYNYYLSQNLNLVKNINVLKTKNNTSLDNCFIECQRTSDCDIIRTANTSKNNVRTCELLNYTHNSTAEYGNINQIFTQSTYLKNF